MPNLNQVRNAIDTYVSNRWAVIIARQETYLTNNGKYWQGLRTHTITPTHTNAIDGSSVCDRLTAHPTDQVTSWFDVFPEWITDLLAGAIKVDCYNGPQGKGWTLQVEAVHNGTRYRRVVNVGPETNRAYGWQAVTNLA